MHRVVVTRDLPGPALDQLRELFDVDVWPRPEPPPRDELLRRVAEADALVSMVTEQVDAELLDAAPRLRMVANVAVGYDNIDVDACTQRGVAVANTPGVLTETTAELTLALILATSRRLLEAADAVRAGEWPDWHPTWMCGRDLRGSTLGVIGFGAVGRQVAALGEAIGMRVIHHDVDQGMALDDLLASADVVTLHVPLLPETTGLIGSRELSLMKQNAILVNAARGAVIDTHALIAALKDGTIRGAGLDVTPVEPLPPDHPLLGLPNCLVLPHIGSATIETRSKMASLAVEAVLDDLRGLPLKHPVNPTARVGA